MNNLEFALEMKNKRLASGLSQGELASLTHVSRYSINRFENGKANASKETQNIILRCLNYYICDKPFYLLVDYLSVRFPTTDALEIIRKVLGMKADYFIHYDYGYYGYKEHYAYGEIKVMASDDEHMGVFLELKGAGSRNMEYVLQAQNRDWYSFLNRCLDCGGVIRRFDLAIWVWHTPCAGRDQPNVPYLFAFAELTPLPDNSLLIHEVSALHHLLCFDTV